MRRLLSTRRHVPLDRADDYITAWDAVRSAVELSGGRAWIFQGAGHEDQFLEFIEWPDDAAAPTGDAAVADAVARLEEFAAASASDEWEEAG